MPNGTLVLEGGMSEMVRFSGDRLREIRETAGITQEELAEAVATSRSLVAAWERNRRQPTSGDLAVLSEVLHVPVSAFFEGDSSLLDDAEKAELEAILSRASKDQRRLFLRMLRAAVGFSLPDEEAAVLPAAS